MNFPPVTKIALYVRDMPKIAAFYAKHFGFSATWANARDKAVLMPSADGCALVLLQASKGHRLGQSCMKIIFDVSDVPAMRDPQTKLGLKFGPIHHGPGYQFANARDPAKNLIQISDAHLAS